MQTLNAAADENTAAGTPAVPTFTLRADKQCHLTTLRYLAQLLHTGEECRDVLRLVQEFETYINGTK